MSSDGTQMEYDYAGYITKKGDRTYYWQGDRLIAEDMGGGLFTWYYYDETGICGMYFNGVDMYFQKNIFGDVIAIYNSVGVLQGRYTYDAWGNITSMIDDANNYVVQWNPFRYRGYYYDQDFGLYYLNSRYYDPSTGRFINADEPETLFINGSAVMGVNLFAYCLNNPVKFTDSTGNFAVSIFLGGFIIGALFSASINIISQIKDNGWDPSNWNWNKIGVAALSGAVTGALFAFTGVVGTLGSAFLLGGLSGFAGNLVSQVGTNMINGQSFGQAFRNVNWLQAGISGGIGVLAGGMSYGLMQYANIAIMETNTMILNSIKNRVIAGLNPITNEMTRAFIINGKVLIMQKLLPKLVRAGLLYFTT